MFFLTPPDVTYPLLVALLAGGLALLHFALKREAGLLIAAAVVLMAGSVLGFTWQGYVIYQQYAIQAQAVSLVPPPPPTPPPPPPTVPFSPSDPRVVE